MKTAKFKMTEVGLIPEDWEVKTIIELTPKGKKYNIVDGPFGSNLKTEHYKKSGIPIITSGFVTSGRFIVDEYQYVEPEKFKKEKRSAVIGGDIVMAKIGERCGASAILPVPHEIGILSGNALKITIDKDKNSLLLIWQILWNCHMTDKFESIRATGAQPAISIANLKKFPIALPSNNQEQAAIAEVLSDTDALILSLEKLIAKKRLIKQGTMQQLLTPKKGWEVRKLGEIASITMGQSPLSEYYNKNSVGLPLIQGNADIQDRQTIIRTYSSVVTKFGKSGDIIMTVRAPVGEIAKATFDCCLGRGVCAISYRNDFLYHLLIHLEKTWTKYSMGSTFDSVNSRQVKELVIQLPVDEREQLDISEKISAIDSEITALETKLEKYKKIKAGMMQQLLTGKIRLSNKAKSNL